MTHPATTMQEASGDAMKAFMEIMKPKIEESYRFQRFTRCIEEYPAYQHVEEIAKRIGEQLTEQMVDEVTRLILAERKARVAGEIF